MNPFLYSVIFLLLLSIADKANASQFIDALGSYKTDSSPFWTVEVYQDKAPQFAYDGTGAIDLVPGAVTFTAKFKSGLSPSRWRPHPGWFVYIEDAYHLWAFDGENTLDLLQITPNVTVIWDVVYCNKPTSCTGKPPAEVISHLPEAFRKKVLAKFNMAEPISDNSSPNILTLLEFEKEYWNVLSSHDPSKIMAWMQKTEASLTPEEKQYLKSEGIIMNHTLCIAMSSEMIIENITSAQKMSVLATLDDWARKQDFVKLAPGTKIERGVIQQGGYLEGYYRALDPNRPASKFYLSVNDHKALFMVSLDSFVEGTDDDRAKQRPLLLEMNKDFKTTFAMIPSSAWYSNLDKQLTNN